MDNIVIPKTLIKTNGLFGITICVFPSSCAEASEDLLVKGPTKPWRSGLGDFRPSPTEVGYGRRRPDIFNVLQYKLMFSKIVNLPR